ncbi:MAG: DUF134 domain-containing protein [Chloroflexota bacterium]|nr:DUF134 domain-containing protein [Chloroflexota bacterium]
MGRPPQSRRVAFIPHITYFRPAGVPLRSVKEVCLSVEEAEAIRLKDLESLEQEECAESMGVSRPTFARILVSARQKMADAMLNGKAIRIEGGHFELAAPRFHCSNGHEWNATPQANMGERVWYCPTCKKPGVMTAGPGGPRRGIRRRRRGRG